MQTREIHLEQINRSEAYRYMGFRGTKPDDGMEQMITEGEKRLLKAMHPRFVYDIFDLEDAEEGIRLAATTLVLRGEHIRRHLGGCTKAAILCATLSAEVDKLIRKSEIQNMLEAMILDALANAAIEQVCDGAEWYLSLDTMEYHRTWRFGVGYGDFPLDTQKEFLNILNAQKVIGVCATENSILTPHKSVTCVIGLSRKEVESTSSCANCNFREACAVRREGGSCGGQSDNHGETV